MQFKPIFILFSIFIQLISCSITVTGPTKNSEYTPSGSSSDVSLTVEWTDSSTFPTFDELTSITFTLMTGSNSNINSIKTLASAVEASSFSSSTSSGKYSYTLSIPSSTVGGSGQYYIQMYAVYANIGAVNVYTPRFNLNSMSGSVTTYTVTDSTQPANGYYITNNPYSTTTTTAADGESSSAAPVTTYDTTASFTVPYYLQTGPYKFAPMQVQPGTKVTISTWTRRFPTSSIQYYYTSLATGKLSCESTITEGWSYTLTSDKNYATSVAGPESNGGWYDPKSRMSLTTRKLNLSAKTSTSQSPSSTKASSTSSA